MKRPLPWISILTAILAMVLGGFLWHSKVQRDRGYYHLGYHNGGLARMDLPTINPSIKDRVLPDRRAAQLFDEGFSDALSNLPARYPYAPVSIDPIRFADGINTPSPSKSQISHEPGPQ